MCAVTACQHFTALSHLHLLKDQCSVLNWSDPDIKYTVPCATANKPFIKTRPKGNFTGSAMDAKGPIVHRGCLTASGWRGGEGEAKGFHVWIRHMGASDETIMCDNQRWEFILLKYFGSLTVSQCPALSHTTQWPSSQKHVYVNILNEWQLSLCPDLNLLYSLFHFVFSVLPSLFFLLRLISFLFWLSWLASPTADYPAVFQCICPPPSLSPSPALSASRRCLLLDNPPACITPSVPLKALRNKIIFIILTDFAVLF